MSDEYVMPNEQVALDAIDYLSQVLAAPEQVPIEEAGRGVAAAVALLNAYVAMRTWEKRVRMIE